MEPADKNITVIDTPTATCWLEQGVFCYHPKNVPRTKAAVEENYKVLKGIIQSPMTWLVDLSISQHLNADTRNYISSRLTEFCSELIIIAEKPVAKILAAMFLRMESDTMPVVIFDSEAKARSYIKQKEKSIL